MRGAVDVERSENEAHKFGGTGEMATLVDRSA